MSTHTIVIEEPTGEPIDLDRVQQLLGDEFRVRRTASGDHLLAKAVIRSAAERLQEAAALVLDMAKLRNHPGRRQG